MRTTLDRTVQEVAFLNTVLRFDLSSPAFSGQLTIDLNHAASCRFWYSSRTSRGVL
jgi:hypothetical protein